MDIAFHYCMRLSACLITKNEEKYIKGCLECLDGFVDEIILVDTGSDDSTVEIARSFGVKVYTHKWQDDFSDARNFSLSKASGNWILVIDADERIDLQNRVKIRNLINEKRIEGYFIRLRCPTGNSIEWGIQCRLFRKKPWIRFNGPVHEQVVQNILEHGGRLSPSDVVIEHLGYVQIHDALQRKWERNLRILTSHVRSHPDDLYSFYQLGRQYLIMGNILKAKEILEEFVENNPDPFILAPALNDLALLNYQHLRDGKKAVEYAKRSLQVVPEQTFPLVAMGMGYMLMGENEEAVKILERAEILEKDSKETFWLASEIKVGPEKICRAIYELLPEGEEKNQYREKLFSYLTSSVSGDKIRNLIRDVVGENIKSVAEISQDLSANEIEQFLNIIVSLDHGGKYADFVVWYSKKFLNSNYQWKDYNLFKNLLIYFANIKSVTMFRKALSRNISIIERFEGAQGLIDLYEKLKNIGHENMARYFLDFAVRAFPSLLTLRGICGIDAVKDGDLKKGWENLSVAFPEFKDDPLFLYYFGVSAVGVGKCEDAQRVLNRLKGLKDTVEYFESLQKLLSETCR